MSLSALVVCADSKSVQMLSRILAELGLSVEDCDDAPGARLVLAQGFDAILVDCNEEHTALDLIASIRQAPASHSALIVALVDGRNNAREVFARGANFILYKPLSAERATTSLRAARALMRRERRQKQRIPVHAQASIAYATADNIPATLLDLSESGISIQCDRKLPPSCKVYFQFNLPGQVSLVRLSGEIVWQDSTGRVGIRFADVPQASRRVLSGWLSANLSRESSREIVKSAGSRTALPPSIPPAGLGLTSASSDRRIRLRHACRLGADVFRVGSNVPFRCTLSDISNGGCYVETTEPFSARTRVEILVRTAEMKLRVRGIVQANHPSFGMGVQFSLETTEEREHVEKLIAFVAQQQSSEDGVPAEPWTG